MAGLPTINCGSLTMRTYNNGSANNTNLLGPNETPIASNFILITSANGILAPTDTPVLSTITLSSILSKSAAISSMLVSTSVVSTARISSLICSTSNLSTVNFSTMTGALISSNTVRVANLLYTSGFNADTILTSTLNATSIVSTATLTATTTINGVTLKISSISLPNRSGSSGTITGGFESVIGMTYGNFSNVSTATISTTSGTFTQLSGAPNSVLTLSSITVSSINGVTPVTNAPFFTFQSTILTSSLMVRPGNVGIGTMTPYATLLHAYNPSTSFTNLPTVQISDGAVDATGTYGMLQLVRPAAVDNKSYLSFIRSSNYSIHMGYFPSTNRFGITSGPSTMLGSTIMAFSDGNVGIGTTTPQEALHIMGKTIQTFSYSQKSTYTLTSSYVASWFRMAQYTNITYMEFLLVWSSTATDSGVVKFTVTGGSGSEPRITILSSTNTNGPAITILQIAKGTLGNPSYIEFQTNNGFSSDITLTCYLLTSSPMSTDFAFYSPLVAQGTGISPYFANVYTALSINSNGVPFCVTPAGSVGIGTATPAYTLDVVGGARYTTTLQVPTVNLNGTTVNAVYCGNINAYNAAGNNNLMIQSTWGIGFENVNGAVKTTRASIDTKTGNANFNGIVTSAGFTTTGNVTSAARSLFLSAPNGTFQAKYYDGSAYQSLAVLGTAQALSHNYFLPYTNNGGYWGTYTNTNSPVIESITNQVNWKMTQNGTYSVTLTLYCPAGFILFISKNMGLRQETANTAPSSGVILALQECYGNHAHASWTGYLTTADTICIGFYANSSACVLNAASTAFKNSISISLIQGTN